MKNNLNKNNILSLQINEEYSKEETNQINKILSLLEISFFDISFYKFVDISFYKFVDIVIDDDKTEFKFIKYNELINIITEIMSYSRISKRENIVNVLNNIQSIDEKTLNILNERVNNYKRAT